MKIIALCALLFVVSGCSSISTPIVDRAGERLVKDLERTHELAEKYAKRPIADCTAALLVTINGAKALRDEPVAGIFSATMKAALLREYIQVTEDAFIDNCGNVAARILVELGKQAPFGVNR